VRHSAPFRVGYRGFARSFKGKRAMSLATPAGRRGALAGQSPKNGRASRTLNPSEARRDFFRVLLGSP